MELSCVVPEIKKRFWYIAGIAVLAVMTAWVINTYVVAKMYQSSATLVLSQSAGSVGNTSDTGIIIDPNAVKVYHSIAQSDTVAASTIRRLGLPITVEELKKRIDVNADYESGIIKIAARANGDRLAKDMVDAFLTSLGEQSASLGLKLQIRVIDPPKVPLQPSSPNVALNLLLTAIAGIFTGILLAIVWSLRKQTANEGPSLRQFGEMAPLLGMIPQLKRKKRKKDFLLFQEGNLLQTEAIRALRSNILNRTKQDSACRILITSAHRGDGKTTCLVNLAVSLIRQNKRVLLVECNNRHPTMDRVYEFFTSTMPELPEQEQGGYIMERIYSQHLDLLFPVAKDELDAVSLDRYLRDCEKEYDYILLDCPPVIPYSDALELSALVQGVLFLFDYAGTEPSVLQRCMERLQDAGARLLGVVANNMPEKKMLH